MTLLLLESLKDWATGLFESAHYLGPFLVLLLCGVGLPLPEEVTLIGSGILLHQGKVEFVPITLVCSAAILIGDSIPFWVGRRWGLGALRWPIVRRVLHPERFTLLKRRFRQHGNWVVFTLRFLPGLRIPGYFSAGTMRMGYGRFLLLDALGVLISVPVSIWLGKLFADHIEDLQNQMDNLSLILAFGVVSLLLIFWVRYRFRRRELELARLAAERQVEGMPGIDPGDGPSAS